MTLPDALELRRRLAVRPRMDWLSGEQREPHAYVVRRSGKRSLAVSPFYVAVRRSKW